jgi:DNA adenine methylase
MIVSPTLTPPLKWAGGKRWLVPHLRRAWEANCERRLVEPFCGGLAIALGLDPQSALLNDLNEHLVNFYAWLKQGLNTKFRFTNETDNNSDCYYEYRDMFNALIADERTRYGQYAAILFYYLNRTGYNGLCRFNRSGEFNVPFGRYKTINYVNDFSSFRPVFANWQFSAQQFSDLVIEADDFVYADPPYDVEFVSYSKEGFSWNDQKCLAEWLSKHRGPVIASNQATERILDLYTDLGFTIKLFHAPRRISSNGDRTPAQEILAYRNLAYDLFESE